MQVKEVLKFTLIFESMTTLKIDIENEQDVLAIKEILGKFNVSFKLEKPDFMNEKSLEVYEVLKASLQQIQLHEKGQIQLKTLKQGLMDLKNEF